MQESIYVLRGLIITSVLFDLVIIERFNVVGTENDRFVVYVVCSVTIVRDISLLRQPMT